ncbi:MAG: LysR family transcriptional regulator [Thiolinea sp.]
MDIAHLKTFLEIYQTRHFGKSAEKLCITQSAASARIKLLEERLGVRLFTRDRHAIEPTAAGHRFHKYAEMTVNGWERARQMVALPEQYTRTLSVGCLADIWHLFVKNRVAEIQQQMPEVALNLTIHPAQNIQELVLNGSLDIGFVFDPVQSPILKTTEVIPLTLQLFANHPGVVLDEAMGDDYIMVDWGALFEYEHSRAFADFPTSALRVNYGIMALDMMSSTAQRTAYLPEQVAVGQTGAAELFPVKGAPQFQRCLSAVYRTENESLELIDKLLAVISG